MGVAKGYVADFIYSALSKMAGVLTCYAARSLSSGRLSLQDLAILPSIRMGIQNNQTYKLCS